MGTMIYLASWLLFGWICYRIALKRGRTPTTWFFLGVALGFIAVVILYLLPSKVVEKAPPPQVVAPPLQSQKLWYYLDGEDKRYGPMSFYALQKAWDDDLITAATYVWNEEMENWKRLEELPNLLQT
ncbi:DUF4339 domain-containing protein [Candidatus Neptunochlamydia vexilliferae]|nr:DUF4339 domain-containing protein [Candidatus Neptunochlamydia vexilliferae]